MKPVARFLALILLLAGLITLFSSAYTVHVTEQVIITQFGRVVADPVTDPGLHFKVPFVQDVQRFDKRILEWDGTTVAMTTKEKVFVAVDTFGRWRISDPLKFLRRFTDERSAQSRLDDIIGSSAKGKVADHYLIELIRTTKDRKVSADAIPTGANVSVALEPIVAGRRAIEELILKDAAPKLSDLGIELLDVRFKRVNFQQEVLKKIYERMKSERDQIADRFRSEGAGEAARIDGERERELKRIESEAYRKAEEIKGRAEAEATAVYAEAYNSSPEAAEFYKFQKTLDTWEKTLGADTTVVLSTDSDLFRLLKTQAPAKPLPPARPLDPARLREVPALPAPAPTPAPAPAQLPDSAPAAVEPALPELPQ